MLSAAIAAAIALLLAAPPASVDPARRPTPYQGEYAPSNIVVVVETQGELPWKRVHVAMSCDGRVLISGAYADSTKVRATTSPDSVLALVNELLALNFFGLKPGYPYERGRAERQANGRIGIMQETSIDHYPNTITLHLGGTSHSVRLWMPAHAAPEALGPWLDRFRALVKGEVEWLQLW